MIDISGLGRQMRELRERRAMTIGAAATRMGISHVVLRSFEDSVNVPQLATFINILDGYGLELRLNRRRVEADTIGDILQRARWNMGITLAEVAKQADCRISTICAIENGVHTPSLATLTRLAYIYRLRMVIEDAHET